MTGEKMLFYLNFIQVEIYRRLGVTTLKPQRCFAIFSLNANAFKVENCMVAW